MPEHNIDVLIVGAGPVGLFCANELMRHGLQCRIIDKKEGLSAHSKALGLHIRTLDLLENCGLIDDILQEGHPVEGVLLKSQGAAFFDADFSDIQITKRHYLIDLAQNQTEAILYQNLLRKGGRVEWNTELTHLTQTPEEITATLKKPNHCIELFHANWLIACDGAHSTVRHQLDALFKGVEFKQSFWLADAHIQWDIPENRMAVYLDKKGPVAFFPMGDTRYRMVMTAAQGQTQDPSFEDIKKEIKLRCSDSPLLSNPIWLSRFNIHQRQIEEYRHHRVFFAGDAAHIHSPIGGQGLNTGIQDIYNLVWKLALVEQGKANPTLLDTYHEERFLVGESVLKKTGIMTRMILLTSPLAISLRNRLFRFIMRIPRVKHSLVLDIAELSISYAKSTITYHSGRSKHIKAGELLPEFELTQPDSEQKISSKKITQGTMHHLFIFAGFKNKKMPYTINLAKTLAERYSHAIKIHLVLTQPAECSDNSLNLLIDNHAEVHQRFNFKKPALILIRPDQYISVIEQKITQKKLAQISYFSL